MWEKSNPLKLFAVFSATFTWLSNLHLTAKQHLIIFKYDEDIAISVCPPSDFCMLKSLHNVS